MEKLEIIVNGMHCIGCSNRLEKILLSADGIKKAKVDLESKVAKIEYDSSVINEKSIKETIEDAGFEV